MLQESEEFMQAAIKYLDDVLARIRAESQCTYFGWCSVDYCSSLVPLSNVAGITTPDAKTIAIQQEKDLFRFGKSNFGSDGITTKQR